MCIMFLWISVRSVSRILQLDLHLHPYKMMLAQELNQQVWETRRILCQEILDSVSPDVVEWRSDEAHFHLSDTVNKQNFGYWAPENPRELHQKPLHSPKVTVWDTISSLGTVRPYFLRGWHHRNCDVQSLL